MTDSKVLITTTSNNSCNYFRQMNINKRNATLKKIFIQSKICFLNLSLKTTRQYVKVQQLNSRIAAVIIATRIKDY